MDAGPTPFMVAQAIDGAPLDFPAMDLNGGPGDMMSMEPAWMADINGMDWVSYFSAGLQVLTL